MIDAALLTAAVIALGAAVVEAAGLLRPPRRPGQGPLLAALLTLAVSCCALSGAAQYREDRLYRDLGRLLSNVSTMTAAFAILAMLLAASLPQPEARPRVGLRLLSLAGCVTGMAVTFALASPLPETSGDFGRLYDTRPELLAYSTLYLVFLGTALTEVLVLAWRHARLARRQPWPRAGLLLIGTGSVLGVACTVERAVYVFTEAAHLPPLLASDHACKTPLSPAQCAFSGTLPIAAVLLTAIGSTLPAWGAAAAVPLQYHRNRRAYRALGPLWEDLRAAFPQITLDEPDGERWDLAFRLYRRVIEIDDARLLLRPYANPTIAMTIAQTAEVHGLRGRKLQATAEASQIAVALLAARASSQEPGQLPGRTAPDSHDVLREAAWLAQVAKAYTTSPLVRNSTAGHRQRAARPRHQEPTS